MISCSLYYTFYVLCIHFVSPLNLTLIFKFYISKKRTDVVGFYVAFIYYTLHVLCINFIYPLNLILILIPNLMSTSIYLLVVLTLKCKI
jgi:hypothetical protein